MRIQVHHQGVGVLEGTGSHDITVQDAFVPEYRTHRSIDGFNCDSPGNAVNDHYIFRLPFGQIFVRAVSSSGIGCLKGVVDGYISVNKDRVGLNDGNKIATDPDAQMALAEAISAVDECQTIMFRNFDAMVEAARSASRSASKCVLMPPRCPASAPTPSTTCSTPAAPRAFFATTP